MTPLSPEIRAAARRLARRPGYAAVITLVLALGLGATIAVFSVLDALVLRPLPLRGPGELVSVWLKPPPDAQWNRETVGLGIVEAWRARATSFAGLAAYVPRDSVWTPPRGPERIGSGRVVGDLFSLLGVRMTLGRGFSPNDAEPAVLSHAFWQRAFAGSPDVVGAPLVLDGVARTIVGVLPPDPGLPTQGEELAVYVPWRSSTDMRSPDDITLAIVLGRLRDGVPLDAVVAELETIKRARDLEETPTSRMTGVIVQSLQQDRAEAARPTLFALFAGAIVLLLVACANVATLALTQLVERRHELAVRTSLGATPWALVRQLMIESLVLWAIGGALGVGLAALALEWFARANPFTATEISTVATLAIDARVLAFAAGITLAAAVAFGLLPAWQVSASDPVRAIREDGAGTSGSRRSRRVGQLLVVGQVSLSTLLVSGAALLALSLTKLTGQPLGFTPENLATFRVQLPAGDYAEDAKRKQFRDALLERVSALPGVQSAATTSARPLGVIPVAPVAIEGAVESPDMPQWSGLQAIGAGYFQAVGIRLAAGRTFDAGDRADGERVAIVNEAFAKQFFPGRDAIGQRTKIGRADGELPWLRIVGVVANVKHAGLEWEYLPEMFMPYDQLVPPFTTTAVGLDLFVTVRVPDALAPNERTLRETVAALDRTLPVMEVRTGAQLVAEAAQRARFRALVAAGVALLAAVLSSIGLYGMLARAVAQRRREIGVRMALGATPGRMLRSVCGNGMLLAGCGSAVGAAGAFVAARFAGSLLYGLDGVAAYVIAAVAAAMLAAGGLAALGPARRTARLSPTLAIRAGGDG
jgi:putative ABC transport system permease protein